MTPDMIVTQWMSDYFETYDDSKVHIVAKGFIDADLKELEDYRAWFRLEAHEVVDSFAVTLNEVSDSLLSDLGFVVDQEDLLDTLKIGQNFKTRPTEVIEAYKNGIMDVFASISIYLEVKQLAEEAYFTYLE
tara:strand:- start:2135 stop:2530 length:396 start_codon:yes stop_codon:yes gene_type:complete